MTINNIPFWDLSPPTPRRLSLLPFKPVGDPAVHMLLGAEGAACEADAYRLCLDVVPDTFSQAANALSPQSWRFLFHAGQFPWSLVYDPCLDILPYLRDIAAGSSEVPPEWLGVESIADVAADAEIELRTLDLDVARAVWLTLSFAKSLRLSQAEVLHLEWWQPAWLQQWINPPSHQQ